MKVLHVIETLGKGGAEQSLVNLLPGLKEKGLQCEVATLWGSDELSQGLEKHGIVVHRLNLSHRWSIVHAVNRLQKVVESSRIDAVHAHLFFPRIYTALLKRRIPRLISLISFHNESFVGYPPNTIWRRLRLQFDRWLTNRFYDQYLAVTEVVGEHYRQFLKIKSYIVFPNAFPDMRKLEFNQDSIRHMRQQMLRSEGDVLIVSPGRLIPQKGHDVLIDAVKQLVEKGMSVSVAIIGEGRERESLLRQISAQRLEQQVTILAAMPHEEIMLAIKAADIVVMPSRFEGFGLVAAEAMGLGKPLIASAVGGLKEVVDDGRSGILVEPENAYQLADAIEALINDEDARIKLGIRGSEHVYEKFSVDNVGSRYAELLHSLQAS